MADSTDAEDLDNRTNIQSENPPGETILANDTETINPNQETENMEVHHHPDLHHKPKKWKEYFLEFLMIFLAVTMGFLAENLREHITIAEKEKHYMKSLARDLKTDTANATLRIADLNYLMREMDTVLSIPASALQDINVQDSFYHHFLFFFNYQAAFHQNDNTLVQLRNAGGYSVIQKAGVADSITALVNFYERIKYNESFYNVDFLKVADVASRIIKIPFIGSDAEGNAVFPPQHNTAVFTQLDNSLLEQLYSLINIEKTQMRFYATMVEKYKIQATALIAFLQKKYNLENK